MDIKDMPHVTVEQVLELRKAAIKSVADNKALREELKALKRSIPKIRTDAIRDAKEATRTANTDAGQAWLCRVVDLEEYANKIEAES